jgi:hypothetical protein
MISKVERSTAINKHVYIPFWALDNVVLICGQNKYRYQKGKHGKR